MESVTSSTILERARLELARVAVRETSGLARALRRTTEVAAATLGVERAGVWLLTGSELLCLHQFVRSTGEHSDGASIDLAKIPNYVRAVHERRVIPAHDALTHPATRELADSYLVPLGITSMLDTPIFREGDVIGVICLEHVGPARRWEPREIDFACSVSDILATVFEQEARVDAEGRQRAAEAKAARVERVEALMRMSASVAHDFKNVLQAMSLASDLLKQSSDPARLAELATYLGDEARRGSQLLDDLMGFCREQPRAHERLDFVEVARGIEERLRVLVRNECALVLELPPDALMVDADRTQIERVLTNLVMNARDAMPAGGKAAVRLSALVDARGREQALLEVRDEGEGIDDATGSRVFEPFFTTKGSGTGLGLASVLGIVEQNGGRMAMESAPGEGTVFRIFWPLAANSRG